MTSPTSLASPRHACAGASLRQVMRHRDGQDASALDAIAAEIPVALAFNGAPFAVMMATPADLEDFALGFALSEGIVGPSDPVDIAPIETHLEGVSININVPAERATLLESRRRRLEGRSGCGICGNESIEAVLQPPAQVPAGQAIAANALRAALNALQVQQPLNARTGATHAAAFADANGVLQLVREDVGRHNALDKLIGAMARARAQADAGFCLITSRASYEMVLKSARAGFALLAAISAPTSLAVALAEHADMTLVGFARADGHVVYSHPHRLHSRQSPGAPA